MSHHIVGWFEIPVTDMDRAETFYNTVFGIELQRQPEKAGMLMSWFPMEDMTATGAPGSLVKSEHMKPSHDGTLVYMTSPKEIEESLKDIEAAGGKTLFPKMDIGEYGFIAWFEDTEGNRVALHRRKDA